jgi:manganese-transporting P-type ATPase
LDKATFIKVVPYRHKGSTEIVPLERAADGSELFFVFQKRKYIWDPERKQFVKITFPVDCSMEHYRTSRGVQSASDLAAAVKKYGRNVFDIPMPNFWELYKEQALQPFFVFQVFCVALWSLDDYFYYSLFILMMLLFFEATVVKSRLANLKIFRTMTIPEVEIQAYRGGSWSTIKSSDLVPGDLVVIKRTDDEVLVPCDMVIVSGSCIANEAMLTGESTPQLKEPVQYRADDEILDVHNDKVHVLFAGTRVLKHSSEKNPQAPKGDGCVAYVLRTGFNTAQGKLVRTILFSSERVTENNRESFIFIFILLIFALAASGYVLMEGLADEARSRFKLLLECTLIITSVVPPELPMELSLAVNTSLLNLVRVGVYCTEPFRIPFAGKVDVTAFDKTGTLTQEHLKMKGVLSGEEPEADYLAAASIPEETQFVMGGCNALAVVNNELIGDPIEIAALNHIKWSLGAHDTAHKGSQYELRVKHRYHFQSALKRMSTIVSTESGGSRRLIALVKGAPEVLQTMLVDKPKNYEITYKTAARRGGRVIAMALKELDSAKYNSGNPDQWHNVHRDEIECDLKFAGFMVFDCPLKDDSALCIQLLQDSSHITIMITGDNPLTACQVASELKMTKKPTLILKKVSENEVDPDAGLIWESVDEKFTFPFLAPLPKTITDAWDLCITGDTLPYVLASKHAAGVIERATVFARTSPEQKAAVLNEFKNSGHITLMCGDGTNDVGALKQAHVGVALLTSAPDPRLPRPGQPAPGAIAGPSNAANSALPRNAVQRNNRRTAGADANRGRQVQAAPAQPAAPRPPRTAAEAIEDLRRQMQELDANDKPLVQLGDASIASPFTARGTSTMPIIDILRQGRCTLVTTLQMFKILALNSLIYAYSLSVLYLEGIKYGDTQATVIGLLTAAVFMFISRSQPLPTLSKQRPVSNLFSPYMVISVIGQFAIHLASLVYIVRESMPLRGGHKPKPDAEFAPDIVNSAVFLLSSSMQLSTFTINYQGHPFMQSIKENKGLYYCIMTIAGILIMAASELSADFNTWFDLVLFPIDVRDSASLSTEYCIADF